MNYIDSGCKINVDDCFDLSHCQYGNYCKENISSTYVLVVNGSRLCLKLTRVDTIFFKIGIKLNVTQKRTNKQRKS